MEQNKNNENNENYLAIFEAAKQLEKEAKEVVEKEINNITMNDIQQILKKLTSLLKTKEYSFSFSQIKIHLL